MQNAIVIIKSVWYIHSDNNSFEEVACQFQRIQFSSGLLLGIHLESRLNVQLPVCVVYNKVDLFLNISTVSPIHDNAHIHRITAPDQIVIDQVFHDMSRVILAEIQPCISKTDTEIFPQYGGEIVAAETYQTGADNYRTELTKIKEASPEAIFMNCGAQEFIKIVREMKELGFPEDIPIISTYELATDEVFNEVGDMLEGRFFCDVPNPPAGYAKDEQVIRFHDSYNSWYEDKFGESPSSDQSLAFDCTRLIVAAAEIADSFDGADIRAAMLKLDDLEGVTGYDEFRNRVYF